MHRFDKRISSFAEEKFQRDGIELKTGYKVVKVSDKTITMQNAFHEESSVAYGMAVWSSGIGTRPVILDFMKQIGQVSFFLLVIKIVLNNFLFRYIDSHCCRVLTFFVNFFPDVRRVIGVH